MQPSTALRMFQPTKRMMAVPKEEQSANFQLAYKLGEEDKQRLINGSKAHTISQRLRTLKKIPPELIPLGIVVGIAVGFAGYSMARKLVVDKQIRLARQNRKD